MRVKAAVIEGLNQGYAVQEVELDDPKDFEVMIDLKACGICHSDDHGITGDVPLEPPVIVGHEGAGIVEKVGRSVTSVKVGDHVCTSFIPSCGRCQWCATGRMYLCDRGALITVGTQLDGTHRFHKLDEAGTGIGQLCMLGEFAEKTVVPEDSIVKIPHHIPFEHACLLSCGVVTGWGSAATRAGIKPGDVVVVWGCGGVGSNAIQGAAHSGAGRIFAIDPSEFKLEHAQGFGATDVINNAGKTIEEVLEPIFAVTNGQGAAVTIMTPGVNSAEMIGEAYRTVSKDGTLVLTGVTPWHVEHMNANILDLIMGNKTVKGSLYGSMNPRHAIPHLIGMYDTGQLKLAELITNRYSIDDINQGLADMHANKNIRGVVVYE